MNYTIKKQNHINLSKNEIVIATVKAVYETSCLIETKEGIKGFIKSQDLTELDSVSPVNIVKPGQIIKVEFLYSINSKNFFGYKHINKSEQANTPLDFLFVSENKEILTATMNNVLSLITCIDNIEKYQIALYLLIINKKFTPMLIPDLEQMVFDNCTLDYRYKLWKQKYTQYCPTELLAEEYKISDEKGRRHLLNICGINDGRPMAAQVSSVFNNIQAAIIKELRTAKTNIKIAMAWFTNYAIYKEILVLLKRNIEVEIITNNDLINNGGYCLDLNILINDGAILHLASYPKSMHHKFCIIDNKILITGSYNWTIFSEHINNENIVIIKNNKELIESFNIEFNQLCQTYPVVDKMPETVPDRPEYDRSAFKHYITEELIFLSAEAKDTNKKQQLYTKALNLSPEHPVCKTISIQSAYSETGLDNTQNDECVLQKAAVNRAIIKKQQEIKEFKLKIQAQNDQMRLQNDKQMIIDAKKEEYRIENLNKIKEATEKAEKEQLEKEAREQEKKRQDERNEIRLKQEKLEEERRILEQQIKQAAHEQSVLQEVGQTALQGMRGKFRINLKWSTIDDLDLRLILPNKKTISYGKKREECQGFYGELDVDANVNNYIENPQENIFWKDGVPNGNFEVKVQLYTHRSGKSTIPFVVTIIPEKGNSEVKSFTFDQIIGKPILTVFSFNYNKETGIEFLSIPE